MMKFRLLLASLLSLPVVSAIATVHGYAATGVVTTAAPADYFVPLTPNNHCIVANYMATSGDCDGTGYTIVDDATVPAAGPVTIAGVTFNFPVHNDTNNDTLLGTGQTIPVGVSGSGYPYLQLLGMLAGGGSTCGTSSSLCTFTVTYSDQSSTTGVASLGLWGASPNAPLQVDYQSIEQPGATTHGSGTAGISVAEIAIDPTKQVESITLPSGATVGPAPNGSGTTSQLFAATLTTTGTPMTSAPGPQITYHTPAVPSPSAPALPSDEHWVAAWAAAAQSTGTPGNERTLRLILHPTIGGSIVRIHLQNLFGFGPVDISAASVGVQGTANTADVAPGTNTPLTYQGSYLGAIVPVGMEVTTDPIPLAYQYGQNLVVSLYIHGTTGAASGHNVSSATQWATPSGSGDHTADMSGSAFAAYGGPFYYLDRIDVLAPVTTTTVVCFGDSITDGVNSSVDSNHRYPDWLAARVRALQGVGSSSIANEGISANLLTADGVGLAGTTRFNHDVLDLPNVSTVILLEGINDISAGVTSTQLIAAYTKVIAAAHAHNIRIILGTLTPETYFYDAVPPYSTQRDNVNAWIRGQTLSDSIVDFDAALRLQTPGAGTPGVPEFFNPAYDSGDHLHPNDAGYQQMANAVNLNALGSEPASQVPEFPSAPVAVSVAVVIGYALLRRRRQTYAS